MCRRVAGTHGPPRRPWPRVFHPHGGRHWNRPPRRDHGDGARVGALGACCGGGAGIDGGALSTALPTADTETVAEPVVVMPAAPTVLAPTALTDTPA